MMLDILVSMLALMLIAAGYILGYAAHKCLSRK
jgi:hypothetical protein